MAIFQAHERDRVQVFIDGPNVYGTGRMLRRKVDWKVLMETLKAETRLVRAQYFTTIRPEQEQDKRFFSVLDFLDFNGYEIKTRHVRDSVDQHGHMREKGSMRVDMAVELMRAAFNNCDHLVLFSGDRELTAAVVAAKELGSRVTVVSNESHSVISEDLRRECDQFVDVLNLPEGIFIPEMAEFKA